MNNSGDEASEFAHDSPWSRPPGHRPARPAVEADEPAAQPPAGETAEAYCEPSPETGPRARFSPGGPNGAGRHAAPPVPGPAVPSPRAEPAPSAGELERHRLDPQR